MSCTITKSSCWHPVVWRKSFRRPQSPVKSFYNQTCDLMPQHFPYSEPAWSGSHCTHKHNDNISIINCKWFSSHKLYLCVTFTSSLLFSSHFHVAWCAYPIIRTRHPVSFHPSHELSSPILFYNTASWKKKYLQKKPFY